MLPSVRAPVAQLDRASDFGSEGRRFEPCWVHHPHMSSIEIRLAPLNQWRLLLIFIAAPVVLYLYLGYLPFILWIVVPIGLISLLIKLIRRQSKDPIIILDEQGVFDRRLKVGVIEWDDIRRISSYSLSGAEYISLELHNAKKYESRRPLWLGAISQVQRLFGMTSIAISTNGLDVDHATLVQWLHEGCGTEGVEARTVDMG